MHVTIYVHHLKNIVNHYNSFYFTSGWDRGGGAIARWLLGGRVDSLEWDTGVVGQTVVVAM